MDPSKAFDNVNHSIPLKKLDFYGIRGQCNDWFRNYLTDRWQIVKYNTTFSNQRNIKCGVPQGSILGPLLFLDLLSFISFADDTNVFVSGKRLDELEILVNIEIKNVQKWLEDNQLTLNLKKLTMLFLNHKKPAVIKN